VIKPKIDRLALRKRPEGQPLMHQSWGKLLFMHWRIDERALRPLIPAGLEIDLFDGSAWIGIIPFTMWDIRAFPPYLPAGPGLSAMHELNVRTYVHCDGVPGVWFFSLDCNSVAAVMGARAFYYLPYFNADIELVQRDDTIDYAVTRTDEPAAQFKASWKLGETVPISRPDSLAFFLTERYCLYSEHEDQLYRARIFHPPWPLQTATVSSCQSTMIASLGLAEPQDEAMLSYAEEISVEIWPLKEMAETRP
jgi:hypothetical protein